MLLRGFINCVFISDADFGLFLRAYSSVAVLRCRRKFQSYPISWATIEKLHMKFIENAEKRLGAAGGTSFAVAVAFLVKIGRAHV